MNELRTRLRNGLIPVPAKFRVQDVRWEGGVDYAVLERSPESFKWWLACLGFLRVLCTSDRLSTSDEAICRFIIDDWGHQNRYGEPRLSRAWDGHAVGFRSEVLVDIARRVTDDRWLLPLLREQVDFLANPANFQGNWNHGVDQARALVVAAKHLGLVGYQLIGLQRLTRALEAIVASDGVSIEQSVHYHHYNYLQISGCLDILREHGVPDSELQGIRARQSSMPEFLAHATKPDGTWFELGDTPWQSAIPIADTAAEYAASSGSQAAPPASTARIYASGFAFGRSGWGTERPFQSESAYAIRFGAPRALHGHHDHLAVIYHANGRDILRDGGFHGYTDDVQRQFLRSRKAHNCVFPVGEVPRSSMTPSEMREHVVERDQQYYHLADNSLVGIQSLRSVFISFDPEAMIVLDTIQSDSARTFEQRWLFGDDIRLRPSGARIEDFGNTIVEVQQHLESDSLVVSNPEDPDAPVVAARSMYATQSCAALLTTAHGSHVAFLTSFSFGPRGDRARITMQSSQSAGLHGKLTIEGRGHVMRLELSKDGRMRRADE